MKRIVVTGPESSGKTTLARLLASELDALYVPEYARIYLAVKGKDYAIEDILNIAIGQLALVESIEATSTKPLIIDTWMLELKIWTQYRFGTVPDLIETLHREHLPHFYVLCSPDISWEPDPLRENPHDREVLFRLYEQEVIASNIPFARVAGEGKHRERQALQDVRSILE